MDDPSLFEAAGGMPFFEALVERFYEGVAGDPELLALYPEPHDLSGARRRLTLFLAQYWGGPTIYDQERGHPRLRMRHFPFAIGPAARSASAAKSDATKRAAAARAPSSSLSASTRPSPIAVRSVIE